MCEYKMIPSHADVFATDYRTTSILVRTNAKKKSFYYARNAATSLSQCAGTICDRSRDQVA